MRSWVGRSGAARGSGRRWPRFERACMQIWAPDAPGGDLPTAADMWTRLGGLRPPVADCWGQESRRASVSDRRALVEVPRGAVGRWQLGPGIPPRLGPRRLGPRGSRCSWGQVRHRPCAADHRARRIRRRSIRPHQSRSRTTRRRRLRLRLRRALELAVRRALELLVRAMETTLVTVRPRFVWGRCPRANGGRRRPRGRAGFYKYPSVISRGSYPVSVKAPLPPAPVLDEFPLVLLGLCPPTGVAPLDYELVRLSILCGLVARTRLLLLARTLVWTSASSYREVTNQYWRKHDLLLKMAEEARKGILVDFGVDGPAIPECFYHKF